jgi:hypothetical protein
MALGRRERTLLGGGGQRRGARRGRNIVWVPIFIPRRALALAALAARAGGVQLPEHGDGVHLPEHGEAPGHLPEYEDGFLDIPVQLPEYGYDHDHGMEDEELPPHEASPPVKPGRPGEPVPRPCIPVVRAVELEHGEEVPSGHPSQPGCLCIVYQDQASPKALGWLQGESDLPLPMHPVEPHPAPSGASAHPEHEFHGHWVRVETEPCEPDHDGHRDEANLGWAYVFEIPEDFGQQLRERVQAAAGTLPQRPAPAAGH